MNRIVLNLISISVWSKTVTRKTSSKESSVAVSEKSTEYRVLARKYRPQNFSELKGQEALVRTLTNAIQSGRIAHAFMLTGVRGVGKTTTARIIARALNCEKGPIVTPCGQCDQCLAIAEDRHVDVIEMDAASNNSVDEIRDLIDSVQYAPVSGRYKIFILDEVHMLSKQAFNALLKTLEEPPEHVKFVFATTEIRKVPVTVLSRCQRFDLRRIDADVLENYFAEILVKEKVEIEAGTLSLIARAADGSARDGLSLLDQAISREPEKITEQQVREMLGLLDRSATLDLFETIIKGNGSETMALLDTLYKGGAAALMVAQDLIDLTHTLTKIKIAPELVKNQALPEAERVRGAALSTALSVPTLTRTWQMLLKGVQEIQHAFNPQLALEMLVIRLLYVSDQPTPSDVLKQLKDGSTISVGTSARETPPRGTTSMSSTTETEASAVNGFDDVVALFGQHKEVILKSQIVNFVHLVEFKQGHLSVHLKEGAPNNLVGQMSDKLNQWTGQRWLVSISQDMGAPTLAEASQSQQQEAMEEVRTHPIVREALRTFPGAKIVNIRNNGKKT
ncbi:MAG: DNA polymerase III subunit gamma/tau [Alphaproteobacteria bacterium]|nr:DNA polymerase III subunit gamma/tau [Alphaproteobacteria bacterium]